MTAEDDLNSLESRLLYNSRRTFLTGTSAAVASAFLSILGVQANASYSRFDRPTDAPLAMLPPQFPAKAKRIIYLHMAGAPSQLDLFDYKPELAKRDGQDTPLSFLEGKNFAFLTGIPKLMGPQYPFAQYGESGAWFSDRLPNLAQHADKLCFIKTLHTDQFNHAPAQLMALTGQSRFGYPSMGSWISYGLGTENQNLPGYIVLLSGASAPRGGKQLWGSGFLPSVYQGVQCRSKGEPVLYLENPPGVTRASRRHVLNALATLNTQTYTQTQDQEALTRISQYEMAFRMQAEASDVFDISQESEKTRMQYGADTGTESFGKNCLIARRLVERGVRFVQLFDMDWDTHGQDQASSLAHNFKNLCRGVDQPIASLLSDLEARGLLEDTLVVWGSEFGRTPMKEEMNGQKTPWVGRDHNPGAFTVWMAGAGVKPGYSHGITDEMGYEIAEDPVSLADFHATILYLLGYNYHDLSVPYQGLDQRLTGVHHARVVSQILS